MTQRDLFQPDQEEKPTPRNPIAHHADPDTSHQAAKEITEEGIRDQQAGEVYRALKSCGDRAVTSMELARIPGVAFDRFVAARRLPELEKLGLIHRCPARTCTASGRKAITWRAGSKGSTR